MERMEKQLTAVEWLIKELYFYPIDDIVIDKFNQAKEMENKQLFLASNTSSKEAYEAGQSSMYCGCYEISNCTTYEDWLYDKTFKSE